MNEQISSLVGVLLPSIKICGLKSGDDLSFTKLPLVTHIGFIFVPESKRYLSPSEAKLMIQSLGNHCTPIGVFVNATLEQILSVARESGIAGVQLHGNESPELCKEIKHHGLQVWKAISVGNEDDLVHQLSHEIVQYSPFVDAILLDAAAPKQSGTVTGGHGVSFDWSGLADAITNAKSGCSVAPFPPLYIAGGLNPENVNVLFQYYRPDGIDISSGVEVDGRKSIEKIHALLKAVSSYAGI